MSSAPLKAPNGGQFPEQVKAKITQVLTKFLPATVEPTLAAPYLRRGRGRPPADPRGPPSKYLQAKQARLAAEAEAKAAIAAAVAAAVAKAKAAAASTAPNDATVVKRGRGRPRKHVPLSPSLVSAALASVVDASGATAAAAPPVANASTADTSSTASKRPFAALPPADLLSPPSPPPPPKRRRGRPRKHPELPVLEAESVTAVDDASSASTTAAVAAVAAAEPTTIIVIPREASYAGVRLLNVARNRQLLAQLMLSHESGVTPMLQPPTPSASAELAPPPKPPARRKPLVVPARETERPLQRTSAKRSATCGSASCTGFCDRCLKHAAARPPLESLLSSSTTSVAAASGAGGAGGAAAVAAAASSVAMLPSTRNQIEILSPIEGEELDKGSAVRVCWRTSSLTLLRGVARWGYVMLVQVTSGKRAIDDYYFPLVIRPGLIDDEARSAAGEPAAVAPVRDDESGRPMPTEVRGGRGRKRKAPVGKVRAKGSAAPGMEEEAAASNQNAAVVHVAGAVYREDEAGLTGTLEWTCPWDLEAGEYEIEVGLMRGRSTWFARSEKLTVVGAYADLVLCLCGDTQHREEEERAQSYVRCSRCRCWSHITCVERWWTEESDADFVCPFCLAPAMAVVEEAATLICHLLSMMASFSGGYMFQGDKLARTPPKVVRFLQSIVRQHRARTPLANVLELGAGEGHIAVALVTDDLFADNANCFVERVPERVARGRAKCVSVRGRAADAPPLRVETFDCVQGALQFSDGWCHADYTALPFLQWLMSKDAAGRRLRTFDMVVTNPDFDVGMQTIYIALLALAPPSEQNPMPVVLVVLPTDFFEASEQRMRIFRMLDVRIVAEYKLGHQSYYQKHQEKRTCDSLFVISRPRAGADDDERFKHIVHDVRLQGLV